MRNKIPRQDREVNEKSTNLHMEILLFFQLYIIVELDGAFLQVVKRQCDRKFEKLTWRWTEMAWS